MAVSVVERLDLPVYGPETRVVTAVSDLMAAQEEAPSRLVRAVRICAPEVTSAQEALNNADIIFNNVAKRTGALVVNHTWGLYRYPSNKRYHAWYWDTLGLLPKGHILVAEVDVIRSVRNLPPHQMDQIDEAVGEQELTSDGLSWGDFDSSQFGLGYGPEQTEEAKWLLDIEPILYLNK